MEQKFTHEGYNFSKYGRYNGSAFAFNEGKGDKLVVFFHGSIFAKDNQTTKTILPVFYGQGKSDSLKGVHILQFSDRLLEFYKKDQLELAWFLDSINVKQQDNIIDVIKHYKSIYNIKDIILYGTSGGGYISLIMAAKLNEVAMFSNSQFILNQHSQFSDLKNILLKNEDNLICIDLFENLKNSIGPKKIYNYCNTSDYTYAHHVHMGKVVEMLWPGCMLDVYFDENALAQTLNIRNHHIRHPKNAKPEDEIIKLL